nr:MAG TPA: hypothetical protein [Caudoviricetes sp.]
MTSKFHYANIAVGDKYHPPHNRWALRTRQHPGNFVFSCRGYSNS